MATKNFTMKSNNGAGWDTLHPKTNMAQVEGLNAKIDEIDALAKGASKGKAFDTVAALDTWLAVAANKATLNVGDNFYIKALDVPDYWWDGTTKQELETQKVTLSNATATADGLMAKGDFSKLAGIATGATKVTSPSDIGAATAAHDHTKSQITDFPTSMPASDVSAWAKAVTKPSYTASEVGAVPTARKVNGKTLDADITLVASEVGAATTAQGAKADSAYQKPGTGIPKTDLETAVQTSLGKADSALQSVADATATVKGIALLGATNGAARYGQKGDVGLGNVQNVDTTNAANITGGTLPAARLGVPVITVGTTAPTSPKEGDLWYDENNN